MSRVVLLVASIALAGCQIAARQVSPPPPTQLELRSIQTRAFDSTDRERVLRAVIATLQDLGLVVFHADHALVSVSGRRPDREKAQMTVSIYPRGATQLMVRANILLKAGPVVDPEPYQQFFTALGRAMFLEAHGID